jgi:hypothetical protein
VKVSTVLTRARRSAAALALEPHPGSKGQIMTHAQIAELDKHNSTSDRDLALYGQLTWDRSDAQFRLFY